MVKLFLVMGDVIVQYLFLSNNFNSSELITVHWLEAGPLFWHIPSRGSSTLLVYGVGDIPWDVLIKRCWLSDSDI